MAKSISGSTMPPLIRRMLEPPGLDPMLYASFLFVFALPIVQEWLNFGSYFLTAIYNAVFGAIIFVSFLVVRLFGFSILTAYLTSVALQIVPLILLFYVVAASYHMTMPYFGYRIAEDGKLLWTAYAIISIECFVRTFIFIFLACIIQELIRLRGKPKF